MGIPQVLIKALHVSASPISIASGKVLFVVRDLAVKPALHTVILQKIDKLICCPQVVDANVFIERLWRSLKYECVYLNGFETGSEARKGIGDWMNVYNGQRPHSAFNGRTPQEAYTGLPAWAYWPACVGSPIGPGTTGNNGHVFTLKGPPDCPKFGDHLCSAVREVTAGVREGYLAEFWVTLTLALALGWSLTRDWRSLRA
jgi:hypothetical protein